MTIEEIKKLIVDNKELSKNELEDISHTLPFFDCVNFVLWTEKILNIKLSI